MEKENKILIACGVLNYISSLFSYIAAIFSIKISNYHMAVLWFSLSFFYFCLGFVHLIRAKKKKSEENKGDGDRKKQIR